MNSVVKSSIALLLLPFAVGCSNATSASVPSGGVVKELDALRDIAKAAHDEYERLSSSVVFPDDTMKTAAAEWGKKKEFEWIQVQLLDSRVRRAGTLYQTPELSFFLGTNDIYVEREPSVFVKTKYYPKLEKTELASLAKCATLREEYEAARLRLLKALLEQELAATKRR